MGFLDKHFGSRKKGNKVIKTARRKRRRRSKR